MATQSSQRLPTAREFGYAAREIAESKHSIRNIQTIINGQEDRLRDLEHAVLRIQTRIWTVVAVIGAALSGISLFAQFR
jgi:hypothetical protein